MVLPKKDKTENDSILRARSASYDYTILAVLIIFV